MSNKLRSHEEVVIEQLRNPEMAKAYLDVALQEYEQDADLAFFLEALQNVAQARSQNLYRVLSPEGNPELRTISLILHNLGYRLSVEPIPGGSASSFLTRGRASRNTFPAWRLGTRLHKSLGFTSVPFHIE